MVCKLVLCETSDVFELNLPENRGDWLVKVQPSSEQTQSEYGNRPFQPAQEEYTQWTRAGVHRCTRQPIAALPIPPQP